MLRMPGESRKLLQAREPPSSGDTVDGQNPALPIIRNIP